jgi:hypothetical protein
MLDAQIEQAQRVASTTLPAGRTFM